jgi:hypothetical protein
VRSKATGHFRGQIRVFTVIFMQYPIVVAVVVVVVVVVVGIVVVDFLVSSIRFPLLISLLTFFCMVAIGTPVIITNKQNRSNNQATELVGPCQFG